MKDMTIVLGEGEVMEAIKEETNMMVELSVKPKRPPAIIVEEKAVAIIDSKLNTTCIDTGPSLPNTLSTIANQEDWVLLSQLLLEPLEDSSTM